MTKNNAKFSLFRRGYSLIIFFFLILANTSCSDKEPDNDPQPAANSSSPAANSVPIDADCPDGYEWNNAKGICEKPASALNINPALISWNTAQAKFVNVPGEPGIKAFITPGTLNGSVVGKSVMYKDGFPTSESILFRKKNVTSTESNTEYFTPFGKFLGILKTKSQQVVGFTPNTDNPPTPAERNCWSACIMHNIDVLNQNAVLWVACVYWGPECAGIFAISCAAHCATH